jgi:D-alanyl-D-alanine-carboxypeptidase/D-alanyl-D-alanine-endopeptidase
MRREFISIIGLSLLLHLSPPLLAERNSLSLAIEQTLKARISRELNQGVVVAVVSQDGIHYYSAGTYREGDERSVNEKTIFEIGSVTKVFTNLLTAEMVERGEIPLYDSIDKYLPASVNLATYLSGLPTRPDNLKPSDQPNPYADYTVDQLYAFLNNYELKKPPERLTNTQISAWVYLVIY